MKNWICWIAAALLLAGCATMDGGKTGSASKGKTGFLSDYYSRLEPGEEGGARLRWIKPGVDFSKYDKIMLDHIVFFFAEDSEYKGMDASELKTLADGFHKALVDTLNPVYPIVAEPGPDVLRVRFAITDLKQSNPVISGVTSVVPVGLAISVLKKGATSSWAGSGATGAEMMALDSLTNEVIAVAKDERSAGFTERFSKWGSADEAFKYWAGRVKEYLDQVRQKK